MHKVLAVTEQTSLSRSSDFLTLGVVFGGKWRNALFDTGSRLSLMSKKTFDEAGLKFSEEQDNVRIGGLNSGFTHPHGVTYVQMDIGNKRCIARTHVISTFEYGDILLGLFSKTDNW